MLAVLAQAQGSYLFGGGAPTEEGLDLTPLFLGGIAFIIVVVVIQVLRKSAERGAKANNRNGRSSASAKRARAKQRDKIQEFASDYIDMAPLINPPTGRARPIPEELIFRPHEYSDRLQDADVEALASDWETNPVKEDERGRRPRRPSLRHGRRSLIASLQSSVFLT